MIYYFVRMGTEFGRHFTTKDVRLRKTRSFSSVRDHFVVAEKKVGDREMRELFVLFKAKLDIAFN